MSLLLNVYPLPQSVEREQLAGGTAVAIDVLRATTTIVHALEAGANEVIACEEIDEARTIAGQFPAGAVILGGERHGVRIDGFDLGNSPDDYTPERVAGKTFVITTTNGTHAIARACSAEFAYVAALVNASAIVKRLLDPDSQAKDRIHILCAGTNGCPTGEDLLLAGMIVDSVERRSGRPFELNAEAVAARDLWLKWFPRAEPTETEPIETRTIEALTIEPGRLIQALRESLGGRNLTALGMDADIVAAAKIDRFTGVPQVDRATGRIRLAQ